MLHFGTLGIISYPAIIVVETAADFSGKAQATRREILYQAPYLSGPVFFWKKFMYLMYLDDSGSEANKSETHLVLAGVVVHEERLYHIKKNLQNLADKLLNSMGTMEEFHCSEIFGGRKEPWKSFNKEARISIIKDVLKVGSMECDRTISDPKKTTLIACAVEKRDEPGCSPMEEAFEDLCSRFQQFLNRQHALTQQKVKGLIILDKSAHETSLQQLSHNFEKHGTRWGLKTTDIVEVPLFVDSKTSRAIQLADAVAYAVFRRYSKDDLNYFNVIEACFDSAGGMLHGLCHKTTKDTCTCPACFSRKFSKI